jgi:hypothetical protein
MERQACICERPERLQILLKSLANDRVAIDDPLWLSKKDEVVFVVEEGFSDSKKVARSCKYIDSSIASSSVNGNSRIGGGCCRVFKVGIKSRLVFIGSRFRCRGILLSSSGRRPVN